MLALCAGVRLACGASQVTMASVSPDQLANAGAKEQVSKVEASNPSPMDPGTLWLVLSLNTGSLADALDSLNGFPQVCGIGLLH